MTAGSKYFEIKGERVPTGSYDETDLPNDRNFAFTAQARYELTDDECNEMVRAHAGSGSARTNDWVPPQNIFVGGEQVLRVRQSGAAYFNATPHLP